MVGRGTDRGGSKMKDEIEKLKDRVESIEDALKLKASDHLVMEHIGQLQRRLTDVESAVARLERRTEGILDAAIKAFTTNSNDGLIMLKRMHDSN
jgi:Mg2+ and Co2+ transporter CorA